MEPHAFADNGAIAMEPQQNPPPGWSPDPAGGPRLQATPARPATRKRRRMWAYVVAAVLLVALCVIAPVVVVVSNLGPSLGGLTEAADEVTFPPDLTLVKETSTGNRICLEECVRLSRIYTSPLPHEATIKIVVTAMENAGYRCAIPSLASANRDWCGDFEYGVLSYWQRRTGGPVINFVVYPTPRAGSIGLEGVALDPLWQSYVLLQVTGCCP